MEHNRFKVYSTGCKHSSCYFPNLSAKQVRQTVGIKKTPYLRHRSFSGGKVEQDVVDAIADECTSEVSEVIGTGTPLVDVALVTPASQQPGAQVVPLLNQDTETVVDQARSCPQHVFLDECSGHWFLDKDFVVELHNVVFLADYRISLFRQTVFRYTVLWVEESRSCGELRDSLPIQFVHQPLHALIFTSESSDTPPFPFSLNVCVILDLANPDRLVKLGPLNHGAHHFWALKEILQEFW